MNGFGVVTNRHVPISVSFLQGSGLLAQQYMFPACPGKPHGAWGIRRRGRETAPKVPVHCGDQTQATKHGRHCYDLHLGMSCYVFAAKSSDEYFGSNSLPFYPLPDSYSRVTSCTSGYLILHVRNNTGCAPPLLPVSCRWVPGLNWWICGCYSTHNSCQP